MDFQRLRRLGLIPAGVGERFGQILFLELDDGLLERQARSIQIRSGLGLEDLRRQQIGGERVGARQNDHSFDDVLELPHVPGPVIVLEDPRGLRRQLRRWPVHVARIP